MRSEIEKKFGSDYPSMNKKCSVCGYPYAYHYGARCPSKEDARCQNEFEQKGTSKTKS